MKNNDFRADWPIIGNVPITDFLGKSIANNNVAGTYIFCGPEYLGKFDAAVCFAKALLCQDTTGNRRDLFCGACKSCNILKDNNTHGHGDLFMLSPDKEKKNISIEQVREFIEKLNMTSFGGFYKVGILNRAELLSEKASNALLKTLEEPKKNTVLILVAHNIDRLPATISSRSQILNYKLVKHGDIYDYLLNKCGTGRDEAKKFSRISLGRPRLAIKLMQDKEELLEYEKKVNIFLNFFHVDINDRLLSLSDFIPNKLTGQELVRLVRDILSVWSGVVRDMLLFDLGCANITQHETFLSRIQDINMPSKKILAIEKSIREGFVSLDANVNPRLVLDNIAINVI